MDICPLNIATAKEFILKNHRHHIPPVGAKFAIGLVEDGTLIGCATVGRPVARNLDNGWTAEVTRLCVLDGYKNACSMLYSACWRTSRGMGYKRLVTYILSSENGASLRASGFKELYTTQGGSWSSVERPRIDKHPLEQKKLFEVTH